MGDTLRTRVRRAAVLAAAVGLIGIMPAATSTASADGMKVIGTLYRGKDTGVPRTVQRGHTVTFTMWYMQRSSVYIYPGAFTVDLWNPKGINRYGSSAPGVHITWLDPVTKQWKATSLNEESGSEQTLVVPGTSLRYGSGYWAHVEVRITFGMTAPLGTWHFQSVAPNSYYLESASGHYGSWMLKDSSPFPMNAITVHR